MCHFTNKILFLLGYLVPDLVCLVKQISPPKMITHISLRLLVAHLFCLFCLYFLFHQRSPIIISIIIIRLIPLIYYTMKQENENGRIWQVWGTVGKVRASSKTYIFSIFEISLRSRDNRLIRSQNSKF